MNGYSFNGANILVADEFILQHRKLVLKKVSYNFKLLRDQLFKNLRKLLANMTLKFLS